MGWSRASATALAADGMHANIWPPDCPTQCAAGASTGSTLKLTWTSDKSVTAPCLTYRSNADEELANSLKGRHRRWKQKTSTRGILLLIRWQRELGYDTKKEQKRSVGGKRLDLCKGTSCANPRTKLDEFCPLNRKLAWLWLSWLSIVHLSTAKSPSFIDPEKCRHS